MLCVLFLLLPSQLAMHLCLIVLNARMLANAYLVIPPPHHQAAAAGICRMMIVVQAAVAQVFMRHCRLVDVKVCLFVCLFVCAFVLFSPLFAFLWLAHLFFLALLLFLFLAL